MAEILLAQDLWQEAAAVVETLLERDQVDPRVAELERRLAQRSSHGEIEQQPVAPAGVDRVVLELADERLRLTWELTPEGVELARRAVRYSGREIVRLFTAIAGPRGVRTGTRDVELSLPAGRVELLGVPLRAVYVAAVGYLGLSGVFLPLARSQTIGGQE
jgi:hypothetical protein